MHFTMNKIKDVSDGLSFLIEGETGEAPSFTEINEVRTSHGRATVSLLQPPLRSFSIDTPGSVPKWKGMQLIDSAAS